MHRIEHNPSLKYGIVFGIALGFAWLIHGVLNNLANLDLAAAGWLHNVQLLALTVLVAWSAFHSARQTRQARSGLLAALVTSLVSSLIGITNLWVITLVFMDTIRHNGVMLDAFAHSGMTDMDAFIIEDALGASVFGPMLALVLSALLGVVGGLLGARLAPADTQMR